MSCSASQWTPQRPILFGSLLAFCFICLFISYKADVAYPDFGRVGQFCPAFLCAERAQSHDSIPSNSTELLNKSHSGPTEKLQAAAVDAEPDTGHAPAESFIHVDDFPSPKELAERLLYLDQNHTEYMRFFNWRSTFKVKGALFGREIACKTCRYLQNHKEYQAFNDLNTWYWG